MAISSRQPLAARRHRPDYGLVLIMGLLIIIGLIVIFSLGPSLQNSVGITIGKQFLAIFLGIGAFAATALVPLTFWHKVQGFIIWGAVITSTLLFVLPGDTFNPDINGARRWLVFGPISFQPSELIKFSMLIYVASFLAKKAKHNKLNDRGETLNPIAFLLAVLGVVIVLLQRDLGTMLVLVSMVIAMLYVSGIKLRYLSTLVGGLVGAGALAVLLAPHRLSRFLTFLDPSSDLQGAGYHINQALIAVGSGGLFGVGLGRSVQANGYLPEAANDSIFAIYAENFGFIGAVLTLALFGALLVRILRIIERAPNTYTRLIAVGIFAWLFSHIVINVGAMLGILPLTGITLPFLSYGGSSLLFMMAAIGLVFNISRYTAFADPAKRGATHANTRNRRRNGRTRHAVATSYKSA